jgi:hypothetical protein
MTTKAKRSTVQQPSTKRPFALRRRTSNSLDRVLRALERGGVLVSNVDTETGEVLLGLLHGEDAWCRVGLLVAHDHFVVRMRAYSSEDALGYLRWRYEELIDDRVDVGPQRADNYGLTSCDMERRISGLRETVDWIRQMLNAALDSGLEFSARYGFDFSPDSADMAWHFQAAA